jgi:hypothetical protein
VGLISKDLKFPNLKETSILKLEYQIGNKEINKISIRNGVLEESKKNLQENIISFGFDPVLNKY